MRLALGAALIRAVGLEDVKTHFHCPGPLEFVLPASFRSVVPAGATRGRQLPLEGASGRLLFSLAPCSRMAAGCTASPWLWIPGPFFPLTFPLFFIPNFCGFLFSMTNLT